MNSQHHQLIASELNIVVGQVERTAVLIDEGATVPFISRYRKEVTGERWFCSEDDARASGWRKALR